MSAQPPAYAITVRKRRGSEPYIGNPEFRQRAIALATTGLPRRAVAARLGIAYQTLKDYLARGRAHPDEEPWGSFADEFLAGERGLDEAACITTGLWVQHLRALAETTPEKITPHQIDALLRVQAARYPRDHGTHLHREPEAEPLGDEWLEHNGITHAQLVHMLREPPEAVAVALLEAGYVTPPHHQSPPLPADTPPPIPPPPEPQ